MTASAARTVRVAAVQTAPAFLDLAATLDRLDSWARPDVFEFRVKGTR